MPDGFVLVPKSIYMAPLEKTLLTLSGPPTRRTSTIRLRKAPGVALPEPLLHAQLSTEAGMPEVDSEAGLQRREGVRQRAEGHPCFSAGEDEGGV